MQLSDLAGKNVVIWGAGREATSVLRALDRADINATVIVADEGATGPDSLEGRLVVRGAECARALHDAEVIVRSPGVSPNRPDSIQILAAAEAHTTATDLWFGGDHAPAIGITGTKGKSTTASLIAHLLNAIGLNARLAGNIGQAPLDFYGEPEPDWWVLELSSYQTSDLTQSPDIGILTSLSPEHLDWHGGYDKYVDDKLNLFRHNPAITTVVNGADEGSADVVDGLTGVVTANAAAGVHLADGYFIDGSDRLFEASSLRLLGHHNEQLAAAALAAVKAAGVDLVANAAKLADALSTFAPLDHRLQPVASVGGLEWIDDGLSTTPVATMAALEAYAHRHSTVLVGGHDRGLNYDTFAEYVAANAHRLTVITMPDSGARIAEAIAKRRVDSSGQLLHEAADLESAVNLAAEVTPAGGVVLLSPAAPSFGRFASYIERSQAFVKAVNRL